MAAGGRTLGGVCVYAVDGPARGIPSAIRLAAEPWGAAADEATRYNLAVAARVADSGLGGSAVTG